MEHLAEGLLSAVIQIITGLRTKARRPTGTKTLYLIEKSYLPMKLIENHGHGSHHIKKSDVDCLLCSGNLALLQFFLLGFIQTLAYANKNDARGTITYVGEM